MPTDKEIEAALRAWWELMPDDPMPWDDETHPDQERYKKASMRDMRAALTAAEQVRANEPSKSSHGTDPTWPGPMSGED